LEYWIDGLIEIELELATLARQILLTLYNIRYWYAINLLTPLSRFEEAEQEIKRALAIERDKRHEQQERALKISEEKTELIESVVKEHQLTGDWMLLKKGLRYVEMAAIREAERRFYTISQRDIFDPSKRTMA
jgi:hypothetical protein